MTTFEFEKYPLIPFIISSRIVSLRCLQIEIGYCGSCCIDTADSFGVSVPLDMIPLFLLRTDDVLWSFAAFGLVASLLPGDYPMSTQF